MFLFTGLKISDHQAISDMQAVTPGLQLRWVSVSAQLSEMSTADTDTGRDRGRCYSPATGAEELLTYTPFSSPHPQRLHAEFCLKQFSRQYFWESHKHFRRVTVIRRKCHFKVSHPSEFSLGDKSQGDHGPAAISSLPCTK